MRRTWRASATSASAPPRASRCTPDEIVKGYEVGPGKHVVVTEEELDTLRPERVKEIAIDRFVPADVDPLLFDRTYHLGPDTGGANAYGVFAAGRSRPKGWRASARS